jgi:formamidopyrimidine-DNA glycosylase
VPELPDVAVYVEAIERRVSGQVLERARVSSPFLVRTIRPPLASAERTRVLGVRRLGKRVVLALEGDLFLSLHLMIAGRLHWREPGARVPARIGLAAFDFPNGTLTLTEAGSHRRAAVHLVAGEDGLRGLARAGVEPLEATPDQFASALRSENRTLKRALTDPDIVSGVGNAFSDEILHRAGLSPVRLTRQLGDGEAAGLHAATVAVLREWIERLRAEAGDGFPDKVTPFRAGMAVHGRYGQPCPACGTPVQRLVFAQNEANYCPTCQTGGRLLADRALSRLLKSDWPRTLEELENRRATGAPPQPSAGRS